MSSSTILIPITAIFLLFFTSNIIVTSSSNPFIKRACFNSRIGSKSKLCIKILKSQPNIVSANNLNDLALAIMQSGTRSLKDTTTYIEKLLKRPTIKPDSKQALEDCKSAINGIIYSFKMATDGVKAKEYDGASYDLLIASTDSFKRCKDDVAAGKIKDGTVLNGNDVALIYSSAANQVVDDMLDFD